MILYELTGHREDDAEYQRLEISNGERHYHFLQSTVSAALNIDRPFISQTVIKALNFHAIACLHTKAGEYRPCPVKVGEYTPPPHFLVPDLMDDFVYTVNRRSNESSPTALAAFVLWRLNHIQPFINGKGRTARAASYFVLCLKAGGWLGGTTILPELPRWKRNDLVDAPRAVDKASPTFVDADALAPHSDLIERLLRQQSSPDLLPNSL